MTRFNIHGLGFTLFLALLTALPALSIDMALPSLALIQADFHAPQTEAAAAIAIFIAGFSSAPIVAGPLADRFGRRAIMVIGVALFTLCAAGPRSRPRFTPSSPFAWCKARAPERLASCRGRSSATCSRAARPACSSLRFRSCSVRRLSLRRRSAPQF
jgi:MFS family permease